MVEFKKGDTGDNYSGTLTSKNGAVDITGYTEVKFYMRNTVTGETKVDGKTMNVTDASNGKVEYEWDGPDVDTPGVYEAEIVVQFGDGNETFPSNGFKSIKIVEDIEEEA